MKIESGRHPDSDLQFLPRTGYTASGPLIASPAIAVLPFDNVGGDPSQEYFSDGLAIEVLDRLGRVPGLRVIASSSSFSFKGKGKDVKFIASQLGVTTVLEGSVRRDGRKS